MYYLDCVNSMLDLSDHNEISKLRNYNCLQLLTESETDALIRLCFIYAPDKLDKHVIFQNDELCGKSLNKFYNVKALPIKYQVSDRIYIGEYNRKVLQVMTYKRKWLLRNWINPMHFYADRLERIASNLKKGNQVSLDCQSPRVKYEKEGEESSLIGETKKRKYCCCSIL